jgi:ANTH domain
MRFLPAAVLALATLLFTESKNVLASAKKPSRPVPSSSRRPGPGSRPAAAGNRQPPVSRRRPVYEDEEDEAEEDAYDEADIFDEPLVDEDDDEEEIARPTKSKRGPARGPPPEARTSPRKSIGPSSSSRKRPPSRLFDDEEDFEEDYVPRRATARPSSRAAPARRGPPPRNSGAGRRPGGGGGRVVPYAKPGQGAAATLTKGWAAVVSALPDPTTVKEAALSGITAARQTTSNLSANIYREVKGLTSSELEQVMLKATRPDDTAVKGKHVERLVGVTYQISSRYDIYDAVLRKLWSKMAEKDWRTTVKALYILHRFAADGSPEHAPALKARLRELRRTRDPKRKDKFFNSKQLLAGDASPENIKFRAFMSRYAHYVLLRAQCFGGMFDEISTLPKPDKKKSSPKPITTTSLRAEHLSAAEMLLKAGIVCQLKEGEECENTAIASERVASDMIGLSTAVAIALNRALKDDDLKGADPALLKKWCVFYSEELLPQTKSMVKKTSPKLDAYGLFLPSRMGTSVSPDLLEKGLNLETDGEKTDATVEIGDATGTVDSGSVDAEETEATKPATVAKTKEQEEEAEPAEAAEIQKEDTKGAIDEEVEFDEEYEYEEEEYYDEED